MRQDPSPHSVYVGDRAFGVYRVAQAAHALDHAVVLRLEARTAKRLFRQVKSIPLATCGAAQTLASSGCPLPTPKLSQAGRRYQLPDA